MAVSTITINQGETVITLGNSGPQGVAGAGVPIGGTVGQILAKVSGTNYDTTWIDNYTENVRLTVKNDSGGSLAKGSAVYISGANGTNILVKGALANSDATSATTVGLLNETLANNATGQVIIEGLISGINTSTASAGDPVWLSGSVAGGLIFGLANKPVAPTHLVFLGTVVRAHATLGEIAVSISNGWELDELHNVLISAPVNGQVLAYDAASGLWKNTTEVGDISAITVSAPITGGGTSGSVNIAIDQTALTIAESQVTNLVTDLAAKTPTSRTISTTAPLAGGGDLSANRTLTIADASTSVKGAVQLTDSTSSTSTTTAATPNSVKTVQDGVTTLNARNLTATAPITGGGTLAADRSFGLDNGYVSYAGSSVLRRTPLQNTQTQAENLLKQAVFWIDANHSSASGQTITNLGWGGSALNATAGSSGSADSNDPKFLDWTGTNYVYIPGSANNNMTVPDEAALDITGDLDVRVYCALDDWTPAATASLAAKYVATGNQRSWGLNVRTDGYLSFSYSADGITATTVASTAATGITDGTAKWVRVVLDVDNGASGRDVKFYLSDDGSTWTQLGSTVTAAGTTSIFASTANLEIGTNAAATFYSTGNFYKVQVLNGIGGTVVLNVDTSVITSGAATSFTALTGQTVTINRATSGRKTCVVTNPLWLFGTDDYINVADNDLLDFSATESLSVVVAMRQWGTPVSYGYYLSKRATGGYTLTTVGTTLAPYAEIGDGTNTQTKATQTFTAGVLNNIGLIVDRGANTLVTHVNGALSTTSSTTTVGSLANANPLSVGRNPNGGTYQDFEGYGMAVFRRVLTTAELALIYNYYNARVA